jgi:PAS domain S-box-containing protein
MRLKTPKSRHTTDRTGSRRPSKVRPVGSDPARYEELKTRHEALLATQSKLEASRARYAELYDAAPVGYVTLSRAGNIEEINLPAAKLLGFSRRQLMRQPLIVFVARHERRKLLKYLSQLRLAGRRNIEVELQRPKGAPPVFVEMVTIPAPGRPGSPPRFQSALIDITARRGAEAASRDSEERFRTLARRAPVGIFLADANGGVNYVNEAWSAMTGLPCEDSMGRDWVKALHPDDQFRIEAAWNRTVAKGASASAEFRFRGPDGRIVWVQAQVSQLKQASGETTGFIGTVADITARKRAEEVLQRAHMDTLAASRAKDDFLAMLSHELRTPLNPVLLLASDAARNRDLPPGVRADFDAIRKNIEMEARLIDDLLDLTRITHGKLMLEKHTLEAHDMLREAIATVQSEIDLKQISLELRLNARQHTVSGDGVRLQQIFWNILKNAIKFTPEKGTITVQTDAKGSELSVSIADSGVGMTREELEHVFEEFSQGDKTGYGGLGLGLAISKKLAELHAGSIHASSEGPNRGATFCVNLPLAPVGRKSTRPEPPSGPAAVTPPSAGKQPVRRSRVLLVEDHEPTRAALTRLLLRRQFEVTGASSMAEARSAIQNTEKDFDILISDIGLPDGSGYDLMAELRQAHDVEGIALTGYGMDEDVQRSHAAGFAEHLTKPVRIELLDQALAAVVQRG